MKRYISIKKLARFHQISESILRDFADSGIIKVYVIESEPCVADDELERYERAIRLYRDLGVNKEGIEIILDMRNRIEQLQNELNLVKRQLQKYDEQLHRPFTKSFFDVE